MKSTGIFAGMVLVIAGLSGCATMSGDECVTSDWEGIGYEDGARGYTSDRLSQYRKACAKHGVTPDLAAYQGGREQGLVEYCQPGRGFNVGANGGRYNGVCRVELEADFLDAYNAGYHLYSLQSNVNRATSSINAKENELERIRETIREKEAQLIAKETPTEERILLLADLKDLSERTGELDEQIRDLYEQRARHQVELEQYQVAVLDYGY
ncbi:MAG: DUF2799 domain-containing protein [Gammaproteobacteria bacterium]|nr:DUF2799 domain-containing protein [Gammaproteobacteria bacterium]